MKKLDPKEKTSDFNQMRKANEGKTFLGKQLDELLKKYGFNQGIIDALKRAEVFSCIKTGTEKLYQFKNEPLYFKDMEIIINDWRKKASNYGKDKKVVELTEEEKAIKLLQNKGYTLKQCVGFDEQRFAAENPELYKKYLIYRTI